MAYGCVWDDWDDGEDEATSCEDLPATLRYGKT